MRAFLILIATLLLVLAVHSPVVGQGAELSITSPIDGEQIVGNSITVLFQAEGFKIIPSSVPLEEAGKRPDANRPGEGHLHFMLDLQPVVVWEKETAYTFTDVPPGQHLLTIELVNNDHSSLTPPLVLQRRVEVLGGKNTSPGGTTQPQPNTGTAQSLPDAGMSPARNDAGRILLVFASLALVLGGAFLRFRRV